MRYCGREFTEEELAWIRQLMANRPELNRKDLSVLFCQAANWQCVGETRSKGKLGNREGDVPTKSVWLYPLCRDFRSSLTGVEQ